MPDHVTTFAFGDDQPARAELDLYETPPRVTRSFLSVEHMPHEVLEPCAGNGLMANVLRDRGHRVTAKDTVERPGVDEVLPFQFDQSRHDGIMTNPPFTYMNDFLENALPRARMKLAVLCPLSTLTGQERFAIFRRDMPSRVWIIHQRFGWIVGGVEHKSHYTNYCWLVWDRLRPTWTQLKFLPLLP